MQLSRRHYARNSSSVPAMTSWKIQRLERTEYSVSPSSRVQIDVLQTLFEQLPGSSIVRLDLHQSGVNGCAIRSLMEASVLWVPASWLRYRRGTHLREPLIHIAQHITPSAPSPQHVFALNKTTPKAHSPSLRSTVVDRSNRSPSQRSNLEHCCTVPRLGHHLRKRDTHSLF